MRIRMMMMMRMRMRLKMTTRCDYRDASQGSPSCDDLPAYPQASLDYHQYQSATSPLSSSPWELYSRCGRWEEQSLQQAEAMQAAGDNLVDLCKLVLTDLINIINLKLSSFSNCQCHQLQIIIIFKLSMSSSQNCQQQCFIIVNVIIFTLSMLLPSNCQCHHNKIVNSIVLNCQCYHFAIKWVNLEKIRYKVVFDRFPIDTVGHI